MKNRGKLICFTGIDGSGKTTLSKMVVDEINQQRNIRCRYIWGAIQGLLLEPFMRLGRFLFTRKIDRHNNYADFSKIKRNRLSKHKYLYKSYKLLVMLDYLPQLLFKVICPLKLGVNLVADRYVFDTAINTGFNLSYSGEQVAEMVENYFRFVPRPDFVFLLDVPEEIAFQRKGDIPAIEYLEERRKVYLELAERFNMIVLDGRRPLSELRDEVIDIIKEIEA